LNSSADNSRLIRNFGVMFIGSTTRTSVQHEIVLPCVTHR
jgi:hypothetical protein